VVAHLIERVEAGGRPPARTPEGTWSLQGTGDDRWAGVLRISRAGAGYRVTLESNGTTVELADVTVSGDRLWLSRGPFPNELPTVMLVVRGDSLAGRIVAGFGTNRRVIGRRGGL
jgi:hypothetical protein